MTVFLAIAAHLVVILGVTFVQEDRSLRRAATLDVILVQKSSQASPEKVDYLAQANQDGGGEHDLTERPSTPLPSPLTSPEPALVSASPPVPPADPSPRSLRPAPTKAELAPPAPAPKPVLAQDSAPAEQKVEVARKVEPESESRQRSPAETSTPEGRAVESTPEPETRPQPTETVSAAALVNRSLAMASLNAEINRRLKAYAERPRRKWITARTREHKYAAYMEAWRQKVERIGNLNYPDEARRRNLSGNLLLDVALNPDGSINEITLRRSSGERVLDDAAVRIVKLAAPYAKFPDAIREDDVDILHIERTWQFLSGDRFISR
ncbi:MAG TPA: TonB family protein [Alphaproteobacteria bacterium]|nr:TonB family protein [Alphaproteobacteria bacterium]